MCCFSVFGCVLSFYIFSILLVFCCYTLCNFFAFCLVSFLSFMLFFQFVFFVTLNLVISFSSCYVFCFFVFFRLFCLLHSFLSHYIFFIILHPVTLFFTFIHLLWVFLSCCLFRLVTSFM